MLEGLQQSPAFLTGFLIRRVVGKGEEEMTVTTGNTPRTTFKEKDALKAVVTRR